MCRAFSPRIHWAVYLGLRPRLVCDRAFGPRTHCGLGLVGSAGGGLAGAAAEGPVGAGGGAFGERAGFAALRAEAGGHPFAGAEDAFEERGYPDIGVEFFEVQA